MRRLRQIDPDELNEVAEDHAQLKALTELEAWHVLERTLEARRQKHTNRLLKDMMRGRPITVEEQLRHAGFWEGVAAVLKTPDAVEMHLKSMLETVKDAQPEGER